jgi:two-component SAPR family response regulator
MTVKENAIYTLGDFRVFDRRGTDITCRFSNKLKILFAFILFNSKDEDSGISTEKLTEEIRPERGFSDTKNIRGVTINHLRNILLDIDGIELTYKNARRFFSFGHTFYCDYIQSIRLMEKASDFRHELSKEMDELLELTDRGGLFTGLQANWIDPYKRDYENMIEHTLHIHIIALYEKELHKQAIHIANTFFIVDPLNEEILSLCIKSFRKFGKTKQSQTIYNRFCERYKLFMGEDFGKTYGRMTERRDKSSYFSLYLYVIFPAWLFAPEMLLNCAFLAASVADWRMASLSMFVPLPIMA